MRLETFCSTLGCLPLQRHLLVVPTHTLEDAVRAGNKCLQIRLGNERGSTNVHQVEDEEEEEVLDPTERALTTLMKTMQQLAEKVGQLQNQPTRAATKGEQSRERLCWECGKGGGHLRRNCPNQKTPQPSDQIVQERTRPSTVESPAVCNRAPRRKEVRKKLVGRKSRLYQTKRDG